MCKFVWACGKHPPTRAPRHASNFCGDGLESNALQPGALIPGGKNFRSWKVNSDKAPVASQGDPALPLWKKIISFPAMLAVLLPGGMFIPLRMFWVDPDVWWHIKVGSTILSTHHFPTADPYSFTVHGAHWIAYQWLGEVVIALFADHWGLRGLMALDMILAAAILSALYALVTMRCGKSKAAFVVCALFLPLVYSSLSLRPQMLAYLFLLLTLIILERFRQGRRGALWFLPPLFLVWVNTHGIFTLGLFALGSLLGLRAGGD